MTPPAASLRPVGGSPIALQRRLAGWFDDEDDHSALIVRTSGSSGEPKGVELGKVALHASAAATHRRLEGPGRWLLALPPHYVAGLQVMVRSHLAGTSPVVLDEFPDLAGATEALGGPHPRYVSIVPTQLHRWMSDERSVRALATYDAVLVGGAAVDDRLLAEARGRRIRVVTTYGMSETSGGCVYDGVPLDGVGVALADDGRIRIAGPVLFDGYAGRPELTAAVLRDGWFLTPDLGRLDGDGRLEVLGRVDDVANSGGVKVPLEAVRRRLAARPDLSGVAVLAVPDDEWGQRVVAVVQPADGTTTPDLAELRDFVAAVHPRAWAPRELVVADLPLLESGKVDRLRLLQRLTGEPSR